MRRIPGAGSRLRIQGQRLAGSGVGVVEGEIIEVFLDPDGSGRRQPAHLHHPSEIGVRRPVGIHGESGLGLLGDLDERILHNLIETVARLFRLSRFLIDRRLRHSHIGAVQHHSVLHASAQHGGQAQDGQTIFHLTHILFSIDSSSGIRPPPVSCMGN